MLRFLAILSLFISVPAAAQDEVAGYEARLKLADQMLELNSPRDQVRAAIERYIETFMVSNSEDTKEKFRTAMTTIINHKALEKIARESYAEIFTEEELAAMVEYYSRPEAISARPKVPQFDQQISAAIVKMMDQAIIRARTAPKP